MSTGGEKQKRPERRAQDQARATVLVMGDLPDGWERRLSEGHRIVQTFEHKACLQIAEEESPEAIVIGDASGDPGVLIEILSRGTTARIPLIVVAGDLEPDDRQITLERGAFDVISSRASADDLIDLLQRAFGTPDRLREFHEETDLDDVTGLPGRVSLLARIEEEAAGLATGKRVFSVIAIEPDDLDALVGRLGADAGREMMIQMARGLEVATRATDGLFIESERRFAVVLPDSDVDAAVLVADRARDLFRAYGYEAGPTVTLEPPGPGWRSSAGIAEVTALQGAAGALDRAMAALASARSAGGDLVWRAASGETGPEPELASSLTEREWAVLAHLARRKTEQEIANRLGIRTGTVRSHKARIRRKLNVSPHSRLSDFAQENFSSLVERAGLDAEKLSEL